MLLEEIFEREAKPLDYYVIWGSFILDFLLSKHSLS
jgi:hypothetical protein